MSEEIIHKREHHPEPGISEKMRKTLNSDIDAVSDIQNPTLAQMMRKARQVVKRIVWEKGLVFYPNAAVNQMDTGDIAEYVLPEYGTPARRRCNQAIRDYVDEDFHMDDSACWAWFAGEVEKRLPKHVFAARDNIEEIELVVKESSVDVSAKRPETSRRTTGPLPWH